MMAGFTGGFEGSVDDLDSSDVDESLTGSALLAPTHFHVSTTSSAASSNADRSRGGIGGGIGHGEALSFSSSLSLGLHCRGCCRRRRAFCCSDCVNAGNFFRSSAFSTSVSSAPASPHAAFKDLEEEMAAMKRRRTKLLADLEASVARETRLLAARTRTALQEERVATLRMAVEQAKRENSLLIDSVSEVKDHTAQLTLRRRKHDEKTARITRFLTQTVSRRETKRRELETLRENLGAWRRKRIEELVAHIFVFVEVEKVATQPEEHPQRPQPRRELNLTTPSIRFDSSDDESPPELLHVCEDPTPSYHRLSIYPSPVDDLHHIDDADDDDDLIVSHLESSVMPGSADGWDNKWIYAQDNTRVKDPMTGSFFRLIAPLVPASGDFSHVLPLIAADRKSSTGKLVAVDGGASPKRVLADDARIEKDLLQNAYAALALVAQLVSSLSFYLDVIPPKKVTPADFMIKPLKVSSFIKNLNKLNTNILFLCFSQHVPPEALHPSRMMHNVQMLLNETVTPRLGSAAHFSIDETLLDSLEESVVIVAPSDDDIDDMSSSSSSSSSDADFGRDESAGEWDYIPADMNIPSLPLNEGFAGGESSTLAAGLSSYSISNAAASVASWWRSNK